MNPSNFTFPPPPPPPPKAAASGFSGGVPFVPNTGYAARGSRGGAPRGRGRGSGGRNVRDGRQFSASSHGPPQYGFQGPSPNGFQNEHHSQRSGPYSGPPFPQVPQLPPNSQPASYPPPQPYYGQAAPVGAPSGRPPFETSFGPGPRSSPYNPVPQQVSTFANNYAPSAWMPPPHTQPYPQPPVMGPPIRMGFDRDHLPDGILRQTGQFTQTPPNPFPGHHSDQPPAKRRRGQSSTSHTSPRLVRPAAAPAVPSFGLPLPAKPPETKNKRKKKRNYNLLGLTPRTEEHEESEEEEMDEEAAFASREQKELQITYKGQTATLSNDADLAAWIEERKKRFPTKARIEAKKAELKQRLEETNSRKKNYLKGVDKQRKDKMPPNQASVLNAKAQAFRERRKTKKRENRERVNALLGEVEDSLNATTATHTVGEKRKRTASVGKAALDDDATSSSGSSFNEDSASSGGDEDSASSDSEPEESSTRRSAPEKVPPPKREKRGQVCRQFLQKGFCARERGGKHCPFLHELPGRGNKDRERNRDKTNNTMETNLNGSVGGDKGRAGKKVRPNQAQRKRLYQRLLDVDIEKDNLRVLQAIRYLAEHGVLEAQSEDSLEPRGDQKENEATSKDDPAPSLVEPVTTTMNSSMTAEDAARKSSDGSSLHSTNEPDLQHSVSSSPPPAPDPTPAPAVTFTSHPNFLATAIASDTSPSTFRSTSGPSPTLDSTPTFPSHSTSPSDLPASSAPGSAPSPHTA
ncbi:MAG: hypothetical protein M1819_004996 [Sarea resinae]|nr:MAG: hypothetical protein M1819_004996 [Sarea resinae]